MLVLWANCPPAEPEDVESVGGLQEQISGRAQPDRTPTEPTCRPPSDSNHFPRANTPHSYDTSRGLG